MNQKELSRLLKKDKEYEDITIHLIEQKGELYNCTLKIDSSYCKRGFYLYPFKGGISELDAIEGAIVHAMSTGSLTNIERVSEIEDKPEKQKRGRKPKIEEITQESQNVDDLKYIK